MFIGMSWLIQLHSGQSTILPDISHPLQDLICMGICMERAGHKNLVQGSESRFTQQLPAMCVSGQETSTLMLLFLT